METMITPQFATTEGLRAHADLDEASLRQDLAACFRVLAAMGWDDLIANHITVRLPGDGGGFLMNPFGLLFEEVTASSLIKLGFDGALLEPTPHAVNYTGFVIHGAIYEARPEINCVAHLHTHDGVAVSMLETGLLPLNQTAMQVTADLAFHEYEGVALELDERERLVANLGERHLMMLRNHGTLAAGRSVASAFTRMYFLERACTAQNLAMAAGGELHWPDRAVIDRVEAGLDTESFERLAQGIVWPAMRRKASRIGPDHLD